MTAGARLPLPGWRVVFLLAVIAGSAIRGIASPDAVGVGPPSPGIASHPAAASETEADARARPPAQAATGKEADLDADAWAEADAPSGAPARTWDPWERFNRTMFRFNDGLYTHAFRPFTRAYEHVVPKPLRQGIANAFENIHYPIRLVGSLLQGRVVRAGQETAKFMLNSSLGVGGLVRVSDDIPGLANVPAEDLGLAFGSWGIGPGPYLVMPILGPGDVRDYAGRAGDYFLSPTNWDTIHLGHITWISKPYRLPIQSLEFVSAIPPAIHTYDAIVADAVDPYIAAREAFLSHRRAEGKR
jgi:phospholipid-binding lipoprotein MlaA